MKKKVIGMALIAIAIFGISVKTYAQEGSVYYTTPNGIELTEEEYNFLTSFYWDGYVDIMTEEQYEEFANSDLLERRLILSSYNDGEIYSMDENSCSIQSTSHSSNMKNLKIAAACTSNCLVNLTATWYSDPAIHSYDVIGAYLSGVSLSTHNQTFVSSTSGYSYFTNLKTGAGIGNSVKLPSSGSNIIVNMTFTTTTGGHIYGSYQHAVQNVTLAVSQLYNFSLSGYGSVFSFYGNAVGKYDGFGGVDISV